MNILKKYRYEIIIFIMDAISMILELVASRIISPYFGNSNYVWTGVIGIILLSTSLGNYIGGKIADKPDAPQKLKSILMLSALFIFIIPLIEKITLNLVASLSIMTAPSALISAFLLFFFPSMCMGVINPVILRLKINDMETAGDVTGRIYALSTIGGLFGTFFGGFVLIPNIGSTYILYVLNIIICFNILLVDFKLKDKCLPFVICSIIISLILMTWSIKNNNNIGERILTGDKSVLLNLDTQYGKVLILNYELNGQNVRALHINGTYESATFTDEGKRNELVYEYLKYYDLMFKANEAKDVMMIGGAAYGYPKYFISHFEDKNMDVIEIDEDVTKIAKKYFYLDDLIKEYNLDKNHRLNLINADGRVYLNNNNQKKYDNILNDAFSGDVPASVLTTLECIVKIKESLKENGAYLTNIISALEGENSRFLRAEVNTLKQVFKNVYVVPCTSDGDIDTNAIRNNMVIATDVDMDLENVYDLNLSEDEIILTDDYSPIDTLIPKR